MARNNETTTKFKVDISELKSAMQEARKQVAYANSEFKAVSSSLDDWSKSSDGLNAKLKQLKSNLDSQEKVLSEYEKTLEEIKKQYGENSNEAREYATKLNNQQAVVNKIKKEMSGYEDALKEVSEAEKIASKTGKDVAEVLADVGDEAEDAEGGFTIFKGAIADFVGNALTSLVSGLRDAITNMATFGDEVDKAMNSFQASTGATAEEMVEFEKSMKNIYNSNFGESFDDIAKSMSEVKRVAGDIGAEGLEKMTTNALILRDTFDFEVSESMRAVNSLMDQFGISSEQAFNLIAQGAQNGLNQNGDLLDVINEYSVHFSTAGYSADQMFNSLSNGAESGTWSVDKLGDAVKEFGIRVKDGTADNAFTELGLAVEDVSEQLGKAQGSVSGYQGKIDDLQNKLAIAQAKQSEFNEKTKESTKIKVAQDIEKYSKELEKAKAQLNGAKSSVAELSKQMNSNNKTVDDFKQAFANGGNEAKEALKEVTTALLNMKDPVKQNQLGVELFGTMWEDLGKETILALSDMNGEFDATKKTMEEINAVKYNSVGEALQGIGRNLQTGVLIPISEKILPIVSELASEFKAWLDDPATQESIKTLTDNIGEFVDKGLEVVKTAFQWLLDNKDVIIDGLVGIGTGFLVFNVATTIMAVTTALKAFTNGLTLAQVAMKLFNLVVGANPILKLVSIIIAVVSAIAVFIATNDEARAKFLEIWGKVVEGFRVFIGKIGKFFTETIPEFVQGLIDWVKTNWQAILLFFINPFAGLFKYFYDNNAKFREFVDNAIAQIKQLPEKAQIWLTNTIAKVTQFAIDLGNKAKEAGQKLLDGVIEKATQLKDKIKTIGTDVVTGLWNGINDKVQWLKDKISSFVGNVTGWLKDFFGINSPSKVIADEVGKWLPEGLAVGITDNAKSAINAMKNLAVDTVGGARAGLGSATTGTGGNTGIGGVVNNFTQVINSPKQLSRLEIYRQSKNLLGYVGGV